MSKARAPTMPGIYAINRIGTDEFYIGSAVSIAARWRCHRHDLRKGRHHTKRMQNSWNKYGESAFQFLILETLDCADKLTGREQVWMDKFNPCFNALRVARSSLGYRHRPETIAKLKGNTNSLGVKHSPEARANMAAAKKGIKHSAEHRRRLAESRKGFTHTPEVREKLSIALKGRQKPPRTEAHKAALSAAAKVRMEKTGWANVFSGRAKRAAEATA